MKTLSTFRCNFCEYDRPPMKERHEQCTRCTEASNFKVKSRMNKRMSLEYERLLKDEEWINEKDTNIDHTTAKVILDEMAKHMHASVNMYGEKTFIISRYNFFKIRKKYLDK